MRGIEFSSQSTKAVLASQLSEGWELQNPPATSYAHVEENLIAPAHANASNWTPASLQKLKVVCARCPIVPMGPAFFFILSDHGLGAAPAPVLPVNLA